MESKAKASYVRMSPRKVQIVLDLIRGKDVETAMAILKYTPKSACEYLEKLLKSAIANAENNYGLNKENLIVSECFVCPGPVMKVLKSAMANAENNFNMDTTRLYVAYAHVAPGPILKPVGLHFCPI